MSARDLSPGSIDASEPHTPMMESAVQPNHIGVEPMSPPLDPSIANLPPLEQSASASIIDMGSSSPDLDSAATLATFGARSHAQLKSRAILGNSASGKLLPSKGGKRHEQPKGIFGPAISLPKIKEFQSHKKLVKQYKEDVAPPKTFGLPPYRGYQVEQGQHAHDTEVSKKTMDLLDSRYRMNYPLRETPHLTWRLHNKL